MPLSASWDQEILWKMWGRHDPRSSAGRGEELGKGQREPPQAVRALSQLPLVAGMDASGSNEALVAQLAEVGRDPRRRHSDAIGELGDGRDSLGDVVEEPESLRIRGDTAEAGDRLEVERFLCILESNSHSGFLVDGPCLRQENTQGT